MPITVTLSGTAEAGAVVRIYDGGTEVASATADASGAWSATASDLADGEQDLANGFLDPRNVDLRGLQVGGIGRVIIYTGHTAAPCPIR